MNILIIGSMSTEENKNRIRKIKQKMLNTFVEYPGILISTPSLIEEGETLYKKQKMFLNLLLNSDLVIAVPKFETEHDDNLDKRCVSFNSIFGESVSYEIAIAEANKIPVLIWKEDEDEGENEDEGGDHYENNN